MATLRYGRPASWAARLTMSLRLPDPTATGTASWAAMASRSRSMLPYSAYTKRSGGKR